MSDYKPKTDYTVKGGFANMLKFRLDSTKWTPSNPGCLGFDASIETCSHPNQCKIGGRSLVNDPLWTDEGRTYVGAWDSVRFTAPAVITGIAQLDPSFDAAEVAKTEGIEFSEPEIAEVRRTEIPIVPSISRSIPYYARAAGRAIAIKDLLEAAAMANASAKVREFCLAVADVIAAENIDLPEG
jgi:hypothetical protein